MKKLSWSEEIQKICMIVSFKSPQNKYLVNTKIFSNQRHFDNYIKSMIRHGYKHIGQEQIPMYIDNMIVPHLEQKALLRIASIIEKHKIDPSTSTLLEAGTKGRYLEYLTCHGLKRRLLIKGQKLTHWIGHELQPLTTSSDILQYIKSIK